MISTPRVPGVNAARAPGISVATFRRVERAAGGLATRSVALMDERLPWFRVLPAEQRSWVTLVAQAGISGYVVWATTPGPEYRITGEVFGTAPRDLVRAVSLRRTVELVRIAIAVAEEQLPALAADPAESVALRDSLLRYSREVAFSAAEVYAQAAEARGAWDARLESLVVDAVIRGEADESMQSRAAALGWGAVTQVVVVVGSTPPGATAPVLTDLHRAARRTRVELLVAIHGPRIICIGGSVTDPMALATALDPHLGDGPLVVGPVVPHLFAAGRSARAAISGHGAAPAWPAAPRPVHADDLLAERALLGDLPARGALIARIIRPLADSPGGTLLETAAAFLDGGAGVEGTARALIVHPNTVRYRLAGITKACSYDLTDPHLWEPSKSTSVDSSLLRAI